VAANFLTQVLGQGEHVQELIKQSAEELSAANTAIKQELENSGPLPGVKTALDKNEAVTRKLQQASEYLIAVNQALQIEIRDRAMVDHQLAAAVEQEAGSRHAALHDQLTGLPNRVLFTDRLEHALAHAKRHQWILAVMFVDLDNFKSINDTYGHQAGDAVLRTVATRLAHTTRNDDTVSRYGGDEFLCLLTPLHEQEDIAIVAAKIRKAIQAPCDVRVGDVIVNLCLEASIGISVFPKDGASAAALITRADDAMYGAKENQSGVAFAQEKAALGAVTHRQPIGGGGSLSECSTNF
jgi:diguanylate cyclase (GGDEF)-like protein